MSTLQQIKKSNASHRPRRTLVYGVKGVGKSTFAAQYPKPIFISTEDGLHDLAVDQFPLCTTWEQVSQSVFALGTDDHDYETVVIDSIDWAERLAWQHLCEKEGKETIELCSGGYGKGFGSALALWRAVINCLQYLNNEKKMSVVLLAHSGIAKINDPGLEPYDKHAPRLHKSLADMLTEWCDEVLFARFETFTSTTRGADKKERTKAVGGTNRVLFTTDLATHTGKNRLGLPEELPFSYEVYSAAVAERVNAIHQAEVK